MISEKREQEEPLVSVIVPAYNHEQYIADCLKSIINQTYINIELIVINDGSSDNTHNVILSLSDECRKRFKRFEYVDKEKNEGIAKTLNQGIKLSKGKYISFIGSDDIWARDKIEKQLEILENNDNLVVWSEGLIIDAHGKYTGGTFTEMHGASARKKSGNIFQELLKGNFICGQSVILKKENLGNISFDEELKYLNDYKFMVDISKRYEFYFISEPLVMYRIHGRNTILNDRDGWTIDGIKVRKYFLEKYFEDIQKNKKTLAKNYYVIGTSLCSVGDFKKGRGYLVKAVKTYPVDIKLLLVTFVSFLGKTTYKKLKQIYRKIKACKN